MRRCILLFALFVVVLSTATSVRAQNVDAMHEENVAISGIPEGGEALGFPEGTVSCFDYYQFGSVQAHLTAPVLSAVSGSSIVFSGTLENTNPYPIVDGALYVKVMRMRDTDNDGNGPDVVDQFLVQGDISIPAHASVPVTFSWRVPAHAQSGDYRLVTFFTTSRKFNLLGLSFTDDVVGNTVPFTVSGQQEGSVHFDKSGVTINREEFHFGAFPLHVATSDPVVVGALVSNSTNTPVPVRIAWTVYQWDGQLRENVVQETQPETMTVPAGKSVPVSVTVTDTQYPVYFAVGTLTWQDTTSIIGVRFVRDGVDRPRINFPGVVTYPLSAGTENTLFSCVHNVGSSDGIKDGRLELMLSDLQGNVIHTYTYTGAITADMMGVADSFVPTQDYASFVLDARLYNNNVFIDEAHLVYDCSALNPTLCAVSQGASIADVLRTVLRDNPQGVLVLGGIAVVLVLGLLILLARLLRPKQKASADEQNDYQYPSTI